MTLVFANQKYHFLSFPIFIYFIIEQNSYSFTTARYEMMKGDELSSHTYYNLYQSRVYDTLCVWKWTFFLLLFGITKTHRGGG